MATTPLTVEVITPELAERVFELIMEVEDETPLTTEVKVLTAEDKSLELTKLAVAVEVTPLVSEVSTNEFVEVATINVCAVMILDVAVTPLTSVVKMLPAAD